MSKKVKQTGTTIAEIATTNPNEWPDEIQVPDQNPASVVSEMFRITGAKNNTVARCMGLEPAALSYYKGSNGLSIVILQRIARFFGYRVALIKIK